MLLEIDNFEQFKIFFDVIYDVTDLLELQLFKDHMVCTILDKARTRFMSVEFKSDFFALYEMDDAESVTIFAEDMHKIIKSASKIESVVLETNDDHLVCRIDSQNGNSRVFEFVLPADYIESPVPPSIPLPVTLTVDTGDIKQGIKDLKIVGSDEIQFTVRNGHLIVTAGVETSANYSYDIMIPEEVDEDCTSKFTLEYIEQILKFDKINKIVEFKIGSDMPLLYSVEDEIMGVKVNGLIAPRIEVE